MAIYKYSFQAPQGRKIKLIFPCDQPTPGNIKNNLLSRVYFLCYSLINNQYITLIVVQATFRVVYYMIYYTCIQIHIQRIYVFQCISDLTTFGFIYGSSQASQSCSTTVHLILKVGVPFQDFPLILQGVGSPIRVCIL